MNHNFLQLFPNADGLNDILTVFGTPNTIHNVKNSLTVKITSSNGSAKKGVRVVGEVCGGISCIGQTEAVYTNSNGYATITFSSGCQLCDIYLDGKSNKGAYRDGEEYGFVR